MKKVLNVLIGIAAYFICAILFMGYGHTETHPFLNDVIVLKFLDKINSGSFINKDKFKNYEFNWNNDKQPSLTGPVITKDYYLWYSASDETDKSMTPMKWISEGGWMEDEPWGPASLCHFYDPLIIDGAAHITDCSGILEAFPGLTQLKEYASIDALTWATNGKGHSYTWAIGKENIIKALKESNPELRKRYMAVAYRCLGQVMHLVCDMGCAPHVRNDSHPPNFYAPLGLGIVDINFWKLIGDPDPVEDICKKLDVYLLWQVNPPDKSFASKISALEKFESIFHEMAMFTNDRFFSGQTIYTDRFKPVIRPNKPYPSPLMTESNYNKSEYTYYKNYDGVNVKMCKDKVPIPLAFIFGNDSLRGRPYLDYDCVKSIAEAVYPNIAEAGANVIKLFVPALKIELTEAKTDSGGVVRGYVTPLSTDVEYSNLFDLFDVYNGTVSLYINNVETTVKANAKKNYFEFKLDGKIANLKKDDGAVAMIEFGGIVVKSDSKKLASTGPIISSLTPAKGKVGDEISIKGTNFGSDKTKGEVQFTGAIASQLNITSWADTLIKVKVPDLAVSGNLKVKYNQDLSNELYFGVPPIISSLSKTTGGIGDLITIRGSKFGSSTSDGSVEFNGSRCTEITTWNDTTLVVKVPAGATTGDVIVKVKGESSNKIVFQIINPQITSIVPTSAKVGDVIAINGTNFGTDKIKGEVFFNALKATEISTWANTSISVKVPTGAASGNVVVRVDGVQSNVYYYSIIVNKPQIDSLGTYLGYGFPGHQPWGGYDQYTTSIYIYGKYWSTDPLKNIVKVNGNPVPIVTTYFGNGTPAYPNYLKIDVPKLKENILITVESDGMASDPKNYYIGVPPEVLHKMPILGFDITFILRHVAKQSAPWDTTDSFSYSSQPAFNYIESTAWTGNILTVKTKKTFPDNSTERVTLVMTFSSDGTVLSNMDFQVSDPYVDLKYTLKDLPFRFPGNNQWSFYRDLIPPNAYSSFSGTGKGTNASTVFTGMGKGEPSWPNKFYFWFEFRN
jgi:hypothetical protein